MALLKVVGDIVATNTITGNNIAANTISATQIRNDVNIGGPRITSISYVDDNTAAATAGGETITLSGSGFVAGATVLLESVAVALTTVANSSTITFTAPAKAAGSYIVYVVNTDGSTAILVPGIQYSGTPTWTTSAGSLGSFYETASFANTVAATGDGVITYSLLSGALPTGATLNSANGTISGSAPLEGGSSTYTFTLNAIDSQNQETSRQFSVTVNTDPVTWSAPANNATITTYEYVALSNTFVATSATGKSMSYSANVLPANVTISGATVSGVPNTVGSTTSLITATAATTGRTSTQTLNFVVAQDVVTWGSPANNTTYTLPLNSANTVSLSATSAAGFNVSYAANSLPTGLTVSGSSITGTPTVAGNSSSLITATAATTGRTAALTLNWVIQLSGDSFWKNVSLLLSANTSAQTNSFVNDASLNNHQSTVFGDTRPTNFNPYQDGYYSNYFDGSGDNLTLSSQNSMNFGTNNFTIEGWVLTSDKSISGGASRTIIGNSGNGYTMQLYIDSSGFLIFGNSTTTFITGSTDLANNVWNHFAIVRSGTGAGQIKMYVNGIQVASGTNNINYVSNTIYIGAFGVSDGHWNGYISNLRIVNGTALYTSAFTPSTTPLTAVSGTSLLTCQSNTFKDNSTNNFTITRNGDVAVRTQNPFQRNDGQSYYFDGTGDYISAISNNIQSLELRNGNFTMELWAYRTGAGTGDRFLLSKQNSSQFLFRWNSSNVLQLYVNSVLILSYSYTFPTGSWIHLALVRNGSTFTLYLNGVSVATGTSSDAISSITSFPVLIGGYPGSDYFQGYLSDIRITKGTARYTTTFTPPTTPLEIK